jgi:hypothetical protein
MDRDIDPIAGNWYRDADNGRLFQVIDVDEREGTVELQHFDGDLEEIELGRWTELEVELVAEPDDWTGPMDGVVVDDDAAENQGAWADENDEVGGFEAVVDDLASGDLQEGPSPLGSAEQRRANRTRSDTLDDADEIDSPDDWEER